MQSQNPKLTSSYSLQQTVDLRRYYFNYINEDKAKDESLLRSMLGMKAKISAKYLPPFTSDEYNCLIIAWVEKGGENHLICTSSMHKDGKIYHAEELMTKALYHLYQNDKEVIDNNKIKVHRMFIDIEPCDGIRYGKDQKCLDLFSYPGKNIFIEKNKKIRLRYHPHSIVYYNLPLTPKGLSASCRFEDSMREQCILGIDLNEIYEDKKVRSLWDKCYVLDYQGLTSETSVKPREIDLKEFFIADVSNSDSVKFKKVERFLRDLANNHEILATTSLSAATHEIIKRLCRENGTLLNKFIKVIAKRWGLNIIVTISGIRLDEINALREIQDYYENIFLKKSQVKSESNRQQQPLEEKSAQLPTPRSILRKSSLHTLSNEEKDQEECKRLAKSFERVILFGQKETVILFIRKLNEHKDCLNIISYRNEKGYNCLQSILRKCDAQVLNEFLLLLKNQLDPLLNNEKNHVYTKMFLTQNEDGCNSLHSVLSSGCPEKVLMYFLKVRRLLNDKFISKKEYLDLLRTQSKSGFTPLHEALKAGHPENLSLYIKALQDLVAKKQITLQEYAQILTTNTNDGFTPLHFAFINGDSLSVTIYLNALQELILQTDDPQIRQLYIQLLKAKNSAGYTALHDIFIRGNPENAQLFFSVLKKALNDQIITKEDYEILLMSKTAEGFTIVQDAVKNSQPKMVAFLFRKLEQAAFVDEFISKEQLKLLFLDPNNEGYTPLHQVLRNGSYENVNLYLEMVKKLMKEGLITSREYKHLLLSPTIKNFTPLNEAVVGKDHKKLELYLKEVKSVICEEEYAEFLLNKNFYGDTALHNVLEYNYEIILFYLREVSLSLRNNPQRFRQLLTEPNYNDITPLQEAFLSSNPKCFQLFFESIKDAFRNHKQEFAKFLIAPNKDGFNCLHNALSSHPENLLLYLREVKSMIPEEISDKDYCSLFLRETCSEDTTCSCALRRFNVANLTTYLRELSSLWEKGILNKEQFIRVLTKKNLKNWTPLHRAASSGNLNIIKFYIEFMEKYFPGDAHSVLLEMMNTKTKEGYFPSSKKDTIEARKINDFLMDFKRQLEAKNAKAALPGTLFAPHVSKSAAKSENQHSILGKRKFSKEEKNNNEGNKKQKTTTSMFQTPKNTKEIKKSSKTKDILEDILVSMDNLQKIVKGGSHSL